MALASGDGRGRLPGPREIITDALFREKLDTIAQMPHSQGLCDGTCYGCSCHVNLARQLRLILAQLQPSWDEVESAHPWRRFP